MTQPILSGVLVLFVSTTLFKVLIEAAGLSPETTWHDPLIWLFLFAISVGGSVLLTRLDHTLSGPQIKDAAGQGLVIAVSTLGTYHFTTHDFFSQVATTMAMKKVQKQVKVNPPAAWAKPPVNGTAAGTLVIESHTPMASTIVDTASTQIPQGG